MKKATVIRENHCHKLLYLACNNARIPGFLAEPCLELHTASDGLPSFHSASTRGRVQLGHPVSLPYITYGSVIMLFPEYVDPNNGGNHPLMIGRIT